MQKVYRYLMWFGNVGSQFRREVKCSFVHRHPWNMLRPQLGSALKSNNRIENSKVTIVDNLFSDKVNKMTLEMFVFFVVARSVDVNTY